MINIVLSGGGFRGIAHLGVLKRLNEMGVKVYHFSATSAGAIVAAFMAADYIPDECMRIFNKEKLLFRLRTTMQPGILKMDGMKPFFLKHFPQNSFESLIKKLTVSATDIVSGKTIYFSDGELITPLMASSSVPVVFKPVEYRHYQLLDGGLLNNLPVEPLLGDKHKIIGVHVNPVGVMQSFSNTFRVMERSFNLAVNTNVVERMKLCDLVIEPPQLQKFEVHQYEKAEELFLIGYDYAKSITKKIELIMNNW